MTTTLKTIILVFAVFSLVTFADNPKNQYPQITLVSIGDEIKYHGFKENLDPSLTGKLNVKFALKHLPKRNGNIPAIYKALSEVQDHNDVLVIAIAALPPDDDSTLLLWPDAKIALINTSSLKGNKPEKAIYQARLERQIIRAIAHLFTIGQCGDPRCVHTSYDHIAQLDSLGHNFSPACLLNFEKEAYRNGLVHIQLREPGWRLKRKQELVKRKQKQTPSQTKEAAFE